MPGYKRPVGLLERWDARNQEVLERQNRTSIEWWAQATEGKPPRRLFVFGWVYVGVGAFGVVVGVATRDLEQMAMGAANVLVWGIPLGLLHLARGNRR